MNILVSVVSAVMAAFVIYRLMKDYRRYGCMMFAEKGKPAFIRYYGIVFFMLAGAFLMGVVSYRTATGLSVVTF